MHSLLRKKPWQWVALLLFAFVWSYAFILTKKALLFFTPMQAAALRISIAWISTLPYSAVHIKKITKKNIRWIVAVAFFGNFAPVYLIAIAQSGISSALAGVLNSLVPFFTFSIGVLLFKEKAKKNGIVGVAIGGAGAIGLSIVAGSNLYTNSIWPILLMLAAVLFHGINLNILKHKLKKLPAPAIVGTIFMFAGPASLAIALATGTFARHSEQGFWQAGVYMAIISISATHIALLGYNYLIKFTSTLFASSVTYIIPVFAIIWGVLDGETFVAIQILFSAVILLGIGFMNKSR